MPIRGAEAEVLRGDPGSIITLLADPESTAGALTTNRSLLRKGSAGAPPHFHEHSAEMLYVLGGALAPHAFGPAVDRTPTSWWSSPGTARFDYYRLLDRLNRGEATPQEVSDSQERFDNHYVDSPVWRQARLSR